MSPGPFKVVLEGWQQFFFSRTWNVMRKEHLMHSAVGEGGGVEGEIKQHLIKLKYCRVGGCK